jgi:hypothetical protein
VKVVLPDGSEEENACPRGTLGLCPPFQNRKGNFLLQLPGIFSGLTGWLLACLESLWTSVGSGLPGGTSPRGMLRQTADNMCSPGGSEPEEEFACLFFTYIRTSLLSGLSAQCVPGNGVPGTGSGGESGLCHTLTWQRACVCVVGAD